MLYLVLCEPTHFVLSMLLCPSSLDLDTNTFYPWLIGYVLPTYCCFRNQFDSLTMEYRRGYTELIQSLRQALAAMKQFPARERYTQLVESSMSYLAERVYASLSYLEEYTALMEKELQEYKENTQKFANSVAGEISGI